MANIIKLLNKEIEKDRVLVDMTGDTFTREGIEYRAKREYTAGLKSGDIPFEKSYQEYLNEVLEEFISVAHVIKVFTDLFNLEKCEDCKCSDAEEPTENTCNE